MCGIFGIIIPRKTISPNKIHKAIPRLFSLSQSRGKDASGIVVSLGTKTSILRTMGKPKTLLDSNECKIMMEKIYAAPSEDYPITIVAHTRMTTHGTEKNNKNNQPLYGKFSYVFHNGIILNSETIFSNLGILPKTASDSESILAIYEKCRNTNLTPIQAIQAVFTDIIGEASVCIGECTSTSLLLGTNTGSIYCAQSDSATVFASEAYTLTNTSIASLFSLQTPMQLKAGSGIQIDTQSMNKKIFTLYKKETKTNITATLPRPFFESEIPVVTNNHEEIHSLSRHVLHSINYQAIGKIHRCNKCIMPETMPLIQFNNQGICNFCTSYEKTKPLGKNALETHTDTFKSRSDKPDCIVPLSGGRDSSYGLHYIKTVLKLNPIAYTYDWGMVTDIARRNQSRMCSSLGVEHVIVSADIPKKLKNIRKNLEAWLAKPDLGMVTLLMAGDKQAEYYVEELKRKTGIKLVIYCRGNQIEDERFKFGYYGIFNGTPSGVLHHIALKDKLKMVLYYAKQFVTNLKYFNSSLFDTLWAYLSTYLMPHDFVYLWHYIPWDEKEIVTTLKKTYGWETPNDTIATWRIDDGTPALYNYIYYRLQGFTEHDGLRSNQIREGKLSRKKALSLVNEENKPRYEALKWYFERLGVDGNRVLNKIDSLSPLYHI